jgi:hypothetical protein
VQLLNINPILLFFLLLINRYTMIRLLISILLLTTSTSFLAQTSVSGGIYQNTTWTAAGSPYLMTGSMVVFPGVTLTIEPGVEVRITPDYSFNTGNLRYLEVRGTLVAIGTDAAPITFKTTDASMLGQQTWYGINIKGSQGGNIQMDRFRLHDSFYGIANDISQPGVSYNWTNCQFKNNNYSIQLNNDCLVKYGYVRLLFYNCIGAYLFLTVFETRKKKFKRINYCSLSLSSTSLSESKMACVVSPHSSPSSPKTRPSTISSCSTVSTSSFVRMKCLSWLP